MPTIIINSEEQMKELLLELVHTGHNLRFAQKYWQEHGGCAARDKKKYWEMKFDGILNRLGLAEHQNIKAIYIAKE